MSPEGGLGSFAGDISEESGRDMSAPVTLCEWMRPVGVGRLDTPSAVGVPVATPNMSGIDFVRLRNIRAGPASWVGLNLGAATGLGLFCVRMLCTLIRDLLLYERPWDMSIEVDTF
jgi:hypothetical protein